MTTDKRTSKSAASERGRRGETPDASTGGSARGADGGDTRRPREGEKDPRGRKPAAIPTTAINVRFPKTMFPLVQKCVEESPVEFGSFAEFVRRAVENELRRRGKIKKFAED